MVQLVSRISYWRHEQERAEEVDQRHLRQPLCSINDGGRRPDGNWCGTDFGNAEVNYHSKYDTVINNLYQHRERPVSEFTNKIVKHKILQNTYCNIFNINLKC